MTPWLDDGDIRLFHGDALETVRGLPDESVDCVVTSPPYWGLRDYGTGEWDGGDPDCDHVGRTGGGPPGSDKQASNHGANGVLLSCRCGARRVDRQMGLEPTPDLFVAGMVELFREIRRVLAPHGTCWVNLGDSYARAGGWSDNSGLDGLARGESGRAKTNMGSPGGTSQKAPPGLKEKDLVGIPWRVALALQAPYRKHCPVRGHLHDGGLAGLAGHSRPAEPLTDGLREGFGPYAGFVNAGGTEFHRDGDVGAESGVGCSAHSPTVPHAEINARGCRCEPGWYLRSDIIWAKPNPMPESVTDRPTKAHEYVFLLTKQPRYWFDTEAVREPLKPGSPVWGEAESNWPGWSGNPNVNGEKGHAVPANPAARNVRSVWQIATQPYPEAHFATYPEELARRCILAGCPVRVCRVCGKPSERIVERGEPTKNGRAVSARVTDSAHSSGARIQPRQRGHDGTPTTETVGWSDCGHNKWRPGVTLDPFIGSGTTAKVARDHQRHAIGIDLNREYLELAARRLQQLSLLT